MTAMMMMQAGVKHPPNYGCVRTLQRRDQQNQFLRWRPSSGSRETCKLANSRFRGRVHPHPMWRQVGWIFFFFYVVVAPDLGSEEQSDVAEGKATTKAGANQLGDPSPTAKDNA
mmetsp:Transcript_24834/g.53999  ORF Transcript_24834/g.53999 Transcript_24834/m.53999 type:complete len:114 (+) Transcript_24834:71-412(+)